MVLNNNFKYISYLVVWFDCTISIATCHTLHAIVYPFYLHQWNMHIIYYIYITVYSMTHI